MTLAVSSNQQARHAANDTLYDDIRWLSERCADPMFLHVLQDLRILQTSAADNSHLSGRLERRNELDSTLP